jgi:hypothetical protein
MSATRVSLPEIPKLSHNPSSYAPWRASIEVNLQLTDCWNAVLGLDLEPTRARYANRITAEPPHVDDRNVRAGSVAPDATETTTGVAMTSEEKREWERWQMRESRAQGMLKGTVSMAVKLDIEEMLSAAEMWLYCVGLPGKGFPVHQFHPSPVIPPHHHRTKLPRRQPAYVARGTSEVQRRVGSSKGSTSPEDWDSRWSDGGSCTRWTDGGSCTA